jgi:hypothetical protein
MASFLLHYTLNTGHTRHSPRSEVRDDVIAALRPLLAEDGRKPLLSLEGYVLQTTRGGSGLLCSIWRGAEALAVFGVCATKDAAEGLWNALEQGYLAVTEQPGFRSADFEAPRQPEAVPWCAAAVFAPTVSEAFWIGDLERCIAWTWIEMVEGGVDA